MLKGLTIAFIISLIWITIEIIVTRIKKPKNYFKAIINGYLISLPFVAMAYIFIPIFDKFQFAKDWQGLFHAYVGHFILFLLYFEIFKHLARSITLSFLVELLESKEHTGNVFEIQKYYSLDEMIEKRVKFLEENGYVYITKEGFFKNSEKGLKFTKFALFFIKLFRSKTQKERN